VEQQNKEADPRNTYTYKGRKFIKINRLRSGARDAYLTAKHKVDAFTEAKVAGSYCSED